MRKKVAQEKPCSEEHFATVIVRNGGRAIAFPPDRILF